MNDVLSYLNQPDTSSHTTEMKIPQYVLDNLSPLRPLRPYQQEAIERYISHFINRKQQSAQPDQVLFHMATGSGKTLVMAAMLLYLYKQGYRNFLFFVNSTTLIEKTKDNFLNKQSSKYLFAEELQFHGHRTEIHETESFLNVHTPGIRILFTTVQGLHSRLSAPGENSVTIEDFRLEKTVFLSDESHHINAGTKKNNQEEATWESTVQRIFQQHRENILLEFTATANLSHPEIRKKYRNKILFDYALRQFRQDGYAKDIQVIQSHTDPFSRALQAVLFNQYRKKLFARRGIEAKPVILFKSNTIQQSIRFQEEFQERLQALTTRDLHAFLQVEESNPLKQITTFLKSEKISLEPFLEELKTDFSEARSLRVNSKEESDDKQIAVHSLEEKKNPYRAIFAVDKLNEGWDVLNLFDIVRVADTPDTRTGKPRKTTVSEAQLIGRGARYFPFQLTADQPKNKRKYDLDLNHEMRICEELYYHSAHNPPYIQELRHALTEIGIEEKESVSVSYNLKSVFTISAFYQSGYLFTNTQTKEERGSLHEISEYMRTMPVLLHGYGDTVKTSLFEPASSVALSQPDVLYEMKQTPANVIRKAMHRLPFFTFSSLQSYVPGIQSASELITEIQRHAVLRIQGTGLTDFSSLQKLELTIFYLQQLSHWIIKAQSRHTGSAEFLRIAVKGLIKDTQIHTDKSAVHYAEPALEQANWQVFEHPTFTSEQLGFVRFFPSVYDARAGEYDEIFLIPNIRYLAYFDLIHGEKITPDFCISFAGKNQEIYYVRLNQPDLKKTLLWKETVSSRQINVYQLTIPAGAHEAALGLLTEPFDHTKST